MENILIITPMGLEQATVEEIQLKHSQLAQQLIFKISEGLGLVEFEAPDLSLLALNSSLRTPNRILLRLLERKCRDLPRLFHLLKKFNWRPYLKTDQIEFKISCHRSRLMHTGRIEQTARDAMKEYFNANALPKSLLQQNADLVQQIYLRLEDDNLTMALDTSGERLGVRGDDPYRGKAAIRENIASGLITELMQGLDWSKFNLVDPMCGSGTFLKEAQNYFSSLGQRQFVFQRIWPQIAPLPITNGNHRHAAVFGRDFDAQVVKGTNLPFVTQADLFAAGTESLSPCIVITNPPYGKRIKIEGEKTQYFNRILQSIDNKYAPQRIGMIVPSDVKADSLTNPLGMTRVKNIKFFNSGIWVRFLIWQRNN